MALPKTSSLKRSKPTLTSQNLSILLCSTSLSAGESIHNAFSVNDTFNLLSVLPQGAQFRIPYHCGTEDVVHEVELGVIFNGLGREHPWIDRVGAYVLLLDMTDRNHLGKAIKSGTPWLKAKV